MPDIEKNVFITKVVSHLGHLDSAIIDLIMEAMHVELEGLELIATETALITVEDRLETAYKMFFVAKGVAGLSAKSLNYYKNAIDYLLSRIQKPIDAITPDDIRLVIAQKKLSGEWSECTCNNNRRIFCSFFGWLHREDYIKSNPMLKVEHIKETKLIKHPFTEYELEKLRANCATQRDTALLEFLMSTGARVAEASMAKVEDVDFATGECKVFGKGKKERIVYLNAKAIFALRGYLDGRGFQGVYLFEHYVKPHGRLHVGAMALCIREIGLRAGVKKTHPHRFRRTTATRAIERGMPIDQVRLLLGHENIQTTTIYAITSQKNLKISHERYLG